MRRVCVAVAVTGSLALAGCGASAPSQSPTRSSTSSAPAPSSTPSSAPLSDSTTGTSTTAPAAASTTETGPAPAPSTIPGHPTTRLVVLRPVDKDKPADGYRATPDPGHGMAGCNGASRSAVKQGIYDCGSSVDYGVACWPAAAPATVYCLQNPFGRQLAQLTLADPTLPDTHPLATPSPLGLILDDGARCRIRDGGSWGSLPAHPDWFGTYFCDTPNDQTVWGPRASDGLNRTAPTWTVMTTGKSTTPVSHDVRVAYFAG